MRRIIYIQKDGCREEKYLIVAHGATEVSVHWPKHDDHPRPMLPAQLCALAVFLIDTKLNVSTNVLSLDEFNKGLGRYIRVRNKYALSDDQYEETLKKMQLGVNSMENLIREERNSPENSRGLISTLFKLAGRFSPRPSSSSSSSPTIPFAPIKDREEDSSPVRSEEDSSPGRSL